MRSRRPYLFLALLIFPFPILAAMQHSNIAEPIHGFSLSIMKPALIAGDTAVEGITSVRTALGRFWNTFRNQGTYEAKIAELENELRRYNEMAKENDRLKKLIAFRETVPVKTVAARVIGWDPSPGRKTILLDKGTNQGIKKDMVVVVPEGLVGRVVEAGASISRVILLTDPDSRVSAMADQSRAQGIVAGNGSFRLTMDYLELDSGLTVEETVVTSGMSEIFPKGIRIGRILSIAKDATGLHLEAQIESYVKFSRLEEVLCLGFSQPK